MLLLLVMLSGLSQRHFSAASPGSPVLHLLWLGTPLPNLPVRAPAADAFTEVPLTDFTAGYCELHLQKRHCGTADGGP